MFIVLWLSLALLAAFYITGPIVDPDLWWHIIAGRWITAHGQIPTTEIWNQYALGKDWTAYSWLPEIIFSFADSNYGLKGLITLKLILASIYSCSLFYVFGKISKNWFFGSFLGLFVTLGSFSHFTLRPQSLVWIIFTWLILYSYKVRDEGFDIKKGIVIFILMSIWANTHLTTILGIITVLCLTYREGNFLTSAKSGICALFGTFLTPNFGKEWLTFFSKLSHPLEYKIIGEFKPGTILEYSTVFLVLILILLIVFLYHQPRKINPIRFFVTSLFIFSSLAIVKFIPFALILCSTLLAEFWYKGGSQEKAYGNLSEAFRKFEKLILDIPVQGLSFVFICLAIVQVFKIWTNPISYSRVPIEAVDFIEQNNLEFPILNTFTHGGYLIYRFSDENGELKHPVPIDGRTNVNNPKIWKMFVSSLVGKENWRDYIDKVQPKTILWTRESPLNALLLEDLSWERVFVSGSKDSGLVIFKRASRTL